MTIECCNDKFRVIFPWRIAGGVLVACADCGKVYWEEISKDNEARDPNGDFESIKSKSLGIQVDPEE